ncbi:unnamed protein product [Parajaminaea phylloscopi]
MLRSSFSALFTTLLLAATALQLVEAFEHHSGFHRHQQRDASTLMSGGTNNEGEAHGKVSVPKGARLRSLAIGTGGAKVAAFWTRNPQNSNATHAYVMIHGKLRNGNSYWTTLNNALQSAVAANYPGASASDIVTAPQFFSTKYNSGQYKSTQLAFGDVNAWQAGDVATHPAGTTLTSIDALDAFVDEFANTSKYPNMKNLTIVGHGGGGQLIARYAQVAKDPPSNLHVRYIMGDPSSNSYFTADRPQIDASVASISTCPYYNTWRYGYDNFTGTASGKRTPMEYFASYVRRDVVSIVGYQDVDASGDTYCMANLQGGTKRRDRNLCWYQYVNKLAGTDEVLDGFPCTFGNLPDWSSASGRAISTRLVVVENAAHSADEVFGSAEGRSALFDNGDIATGWRPSGWKASSKAVVPGVTKTSLASSNSGGSSNSNTTSGNKATLASSVAGTSSAARAVPAGIAFTVSACLVLAASVSLYSL